LQVAKRIEDESRFLRDIQHEVERVIVGQRELIDRLLIGILAQGHVLVEGVPGLAKSLTVSTLARTLDLEFKRIQFTPDLLPADLIGTPIFNQRSGEFTIKRGPIFANVVLADEINRAPAKVQSALLEAMQERQVTISDQTFKLEEPFLVLATQNPIEQEGTYPLPEAQVDRFLFKVKVTYPTREEEKEIVARMARTGTVGEVRAVAGAAEIMRARAVLNDVYLDDKVTDYILSLVHATRAPAQAGLDKLKDLVQYGASPRASIALTLTAKAHAFLKGRGYVTPQDVKSIGMDVLRHRVLLTYEAEAEEKTVDDVLKEIFDHVPVP
jgi:MoxR-like ATPase